MSAVEASLPRDSGDGVYLQDCADAIAGKPAPTVAGCGCGVSAVGASLPRDPVDGVHLQDRGDAIAGKPFPQWWGVGVGCLL